MPRLGWRPIVLIVTNVVIIAALLGLGTWQLQRRHWKIDLIAQVEERRNAPPLPAPTPDAWDKVTAESYSYRHVYARGTFMHDHETFVQAVTSRGPGFWVMTPMQTDQGFIVLINRGFVTPERRDPATRAAGLSADKVTVTGLLRMTEPKGGFLRANNSSTGRWYSRDVAAIGDSQKLTQVAPYFIDADSRPNPGGWPIGGLTIVTFQNNHLIYALTWYALALVLAVITLIFLRDHDPSKRE